MKILVLSSGKKKCGVRDYTKALMKNILSINGLKFDVLWLNKENPIYSYVQILKKIQKEKIDVIHLQHEFDIFDNYYGITFLIFSPFLWLLCKFKKIKIITTFHSVFSLDLLEEGVDPKWTRNLFLKTIARFYLFVHVWMLGKLMDKCIVLNKPAIKTLTDQYGIRRKEKIVYIPHGIPKLNLKIPEKDIKKFKKKYELLGNKKIISLVGFAYKTKGYHHAINALSIVAKKYSNVRMVITGGFDSEKGEEYVHFLRREIKRNNLEKWITIMGYLPENELKILLNLTDVFVFPYGYRVNASGIVNLAINAKKPIIVSNAPLFSDMIKEGLAIPVDPENTVELSGAMVKAITVPAPKKMISRVDTYINQNSMEVAALIHQRLYKSVTT